MSSRHTFVTLVALGLVTAAQGAAAQDPGEPRWRITPSPATPELAHPSDPKFVQCPLVQARTEIVSELPKGWWQTPYEGPLVGTRVQVVGDDKLLICDYQAYTTQAGVMMRVPVSMNCVAVDGGFSCR